MKTVMSEKDKTITKQKNVYKEMRLLREKHKYSEKERLQQDTVIRDLKTSLAITTKDNLALRKKLFKKEPV